MQDLAEAARQVLLQVEKDEHGTVRVPEETIESLENAYGHLQDLHESGESTDPEEWPPSFSFTPEGVAAVYLMSVDAEAGREEQKELAAIFRAYWRGGLQGESTDTPQPAF